VISADRIAVALLLLLAAPETRAFAQSTAAQQSRAMQLTEAEQQIVRNVDARGEEAVEFLRRIVNVNSWTRNHNGVRKVAREFERRLQAIGFQTRWVPLPQKLGRAGHFFAERAGSAGRGQRGSQTASDRTFGHRLRRG
jgi:hypothetical protein